MDNRKDWLAQLPDTITLKKIYTKNMTEPVRQLSPNTYIVLMTQGHSFDFPILLEVLKTRQAPFLGVIGSRQKALVLKKELKKAGIEPKICESFYCPLGLPIGDNVPEEIAISIAAQLLQVRGTCRKRLRDPNVL